MMFFGVRLLGLLAIAFPAAAQLDSPALRTKFGSPLPRETFHMAAGFDLVADYGPNGQVCKLQVPSLMPSDEKVSNIDTMRRRMYDFLLQVVPASMRGREVGGFMSSTGANHSVVVTQYEKATFTEVRLAEPPMGGTLTVQFNSDACPKRSR